MITAQELSLLEEIKKAYIADENYFTGVLNGQSFKIRMNKDHGRNSLRNDDQDDHNLSLVSDNDPTCRVFRKTSTGKLQWQVQNIADWEDAEEQILEFFYQINEGY